MQEKQKLIPVRDVRMIVLIETTFEIKVHKLVRHHCWIKIFSSLFSLMRFPSNIRRTLKEIFLGTFHKVYTVNHGQEEEELRHWINEDSATNLSNFDEATNIC